MKAYMLALPINDNSGKDMNAAHATFQKLAVSIAGGYTKRPSGEGAWRDDDTGKTHYDRMIPYIFACERATFDVLKRLAFDLFPDQIALYWQELDGVQIERRPPSRQPDKATRRDRDKPCMGERAS